MTKIFAAILFLFVFGQSASACPICRAQANAIINQDFWQNFSLLLLPLLLLALVGAALFYANELKGFLKWRKTNFR